MKRISRHLRLGFLISGVTMILVGAAIFTSGTEAEKLTQPAFQSSVQDKPTNDYCLSCHSQRGLNKPLPDGETLSLYIDPTLFKQSVHSQENLACVDCHTNISTYPHPTYQPNTIRDITLQLYTSCKNCHAPEYGKTLDSVHQQALSVGNFNAAVCTDCHNPHQQTRMTDPKTGQLLPSVRLSIPQTCARCHSVIYDQYKGSVHGEALTQNNPDVPTCIDCHGVHNIQSPVSVRFHNDTPELCAKCHSNPDIMNKYGISTQVLNTYVSDFHGTTVTIFEQISPDTPTNKPVCTDCHGVHDIGWVNDPATGIAIKQNLLPKCQRCHPSVTSANFTEAWMDHYIASPTQYPLVFYVNLFYALLIPAVIGGMLVFVIADFVRRAIGDRKGTKS
ncbi:MAG TPA: cytochrome c3 family protein [Anaerolineales bacterium]|nr:cytochrome c3 family protein [Anaerolineales bacterium]